MGARLSSLGGKARDIRISVRNCVKQMIKRPTNKVMVQHALILIEVLNLKPLRVKVKRIKDPDDATDIRSEGSDLLSNDDLLSGVGTTGGQTLPTDFLVEDSLSLHESDLEDLNPLHDPSPAQLTKGTKRSKRVTTYFYNKIKGDFKQVDLFAFKLKKKTGSMTTSAILSHALDCNQAVVDLENMLSALLLRTAAVKKQNYNTRTLSRARMRQGSTQKPVNLIKPGTKLKGTILVPEQSVFDDTDLEGRLENLDATLTTLQQDEERPYQMEILREAKDEENELYFVGRHQTYDGRRDKQTILMRLKPEGGILHVRYQDYETHCDGRVENDSFMHGDVRQLKRGQPGFYVQTLDNENYRFELRKTDDSENEKMIKLRAKIYLARSARALAFAAWCGSASESRIRNQKFPGVQIKWNEIVDDMAWICDEVGNTLRRFIAILDGLRFENAVNRKNRLEKLGEKGLRRQRVHEFWDAASILLDRVKEVVPSGADNSQVEMNATLKFTDKVSRRIAPLYDRFDESMRKAEKRVCDDIRNTFRQIYKPEVKRKLDSRSFSSQSRKGSKEVMTEIQRTPSKPSAFSRKSTESDEDEAMCSVCMDGFSFGEMIYVTTCLHAFHINCLDESFDKGGLDGCPICRKDFSQQEP